MFFLKNSFTANRTVMMMTVTFARMHCAMVVSRILSFPTKPTAKVVKWAVFHFGRRLVTFLAIPRLRADEHADGRRNVCHWIEKSQNRRTHALGRGKVSRRVGKSTWDSCNTGFIDFHWFSLLLTCFSVNFNVFWCFNCCMEWFFWLVFLVFLDVCVCCWNGRKFFRWLLRENGRWKEEIAEIVL